MKIHYTVFIGPTEVKSACKRWVRGLYATTSKEHVTCKRCNRLIKKQEGSAVEAPCW